MPARTEAVLPLSDDPDSRREAKRSLARLKPRVKPIFATDPDAWALFDARLDRHFDRLFLTLRRLYGRQYDFFWHLEQVVSTAAQQMLARSTDLRADDAAAEASPAWFRSHKEIGAVCYVDLWARDGGPENGRAGTLAGVSDKLDHLRSMGVTYLHLMPLLKTRPAPNDGGYAVSDYRQVEPRFGTMADLEALAATLRGEGIRLCLDLVFNHTADDHHWAQAAAAGDDEKRDYYRTFPDRDLPDQYQPHLREIFPDRGSENFLWVSSLNRYVWSTFYPFQWDLNFANPALFRQMLEEMLFLANRGISILRLDAVPFVWKELGTPSENLPEAHLVVQALNAAVQLAAPALTFKSEAIVHPDDVVAYVSPHEAQLSYNPLLMVLLWEALATRDTTLIRHSLMKRFALPEETAWVNYVRCHDDIGWGFADEDCHEVGIAPDDHRRFLNAFYTGRFPGSFARGLPFQDNPRTGDCRICGMTASLAGLEAAVADGDETATTLAVRRIILMHAVIMTIGGIPLIYLGDEVAILNDYSYLDDPDKAPDARWVHRPVMDWSRPSLAQSQDPPRQPEAGPQAGSQTPDTRVLAAIRALAALRRGHSVFDQGPLTILPLDNKHLFGVLKSQDHGHGTDSVVLLGNFSEHPQPLNDWGLPGVLGSDRFDDLWTGQRFRFAPGLVLEPYAFHCLSPARPGASNL